MRLLTELPASRPSILLMDVDDTVAPSTQPILPPMRQALCDLADAGFGLVFVSGGSVEQMWGQVTRELPRHHTLLGTSGSHAVAVTHSPQGPQRVELFRQGFSDGERADILAALQALIERFKIVPDTSTADQLQDRGCQFTLSAIGRSAADARKRAFDPDGSLRKVWVAFLEERLGAGRFSLRVGGTSSIDITAPGVDKGSGLRQLLGLKGWDAAACLYFGDRFEETGNDTPVLQVMDCVVVQSPADTLRHYHALLGRA